MHFFYIYEDTLPSFEQMLLNFRVKHFPVKQNKKTQNEIGRG